MSQSSRRSRFYNLITCDRSARREKEPTHWLPRAPSPRRTMTDLTPRKINVWPNDRSIEMLRPVVAILDPKVKYSLLSKSVIRTDLTQLSDPPTKQVRDSNGEVYDCIKVMPGNWRITGRGSTVADNFVIAYGSFPEGVDVLLAPSDNNKKQIKKVAENEDYSLVLIGKAKNQHAEKQARVTIKQRQEDEEEIDDREYIEKLKKLKQNKRDAIADASKNTNTNNGANSQGPTSSRSA